VTDVSRGKEAPLNALANTSRRASKNHGVLIDGEIWKGFVNISASIASASGCAHGCSAKRTVQGKIHRWTRWNISG
jgi:hypothetical protein